MKITRRAFIDGLKQPSSLQTFVLVTFVAFVYFWRARPYLLKPQLFAEDGVLWLAEGYNKNILALFQPVNGFLHFPERLFGFVVAHLPLQYAPLLFVLTAWGLFMLLACYLISSRTKILANTYQRVFMALALCLIANLQEFFFNFSNSVFLMGIIGALIMVARPAKYKAVEVAEKAFFLLSSLTLPFAWFYLPIALFERFKYRKKTSFYLYVSLVASVVQLIYFLTSHVNRSPITIFSLFSEYTLLEIYNQMIIPAVRFARIDIPILDFTEHIYPVSIVFLSILTLLIAAIIVVKNSNRQVNYLLFFLAAMTLASIKSPTVNVPQALDAIKHMAIVTGANRYFVYGIVAVNLIFVKAAYMAIAPRARYAFMLLFVAFGLVTSLHYQSFYINKDFMDFTVQYRDGISRFQSGKVKSVNILVNPSPWNMMLNRH